MRTGGWNSRGRFVAVSGHFKFGLKVTASVQAAVKHNEIYLRKHTETFRGSTVTDFCEESEHQIEPFSTSTRPALQGAASITGPTSFASHRIKTTLANFEVGDFSLLAILTRYIRDYTSIDTHDHAHASGQQRVEQDSGRASTEKSPPAVFISYFTAGGLGSRKFA